MSTEFDYNKLVEESRKLAFSSMNLSDLSKYFPKESNEESTKKICERAEALEQIEKLLKEKELHQQNLESINSISLTTQLGDADEALQQYQNTKNYILGKIAEIDNKIQTQQEIVSKVNEWIRLKLAQFDVIHKTTSRADIVRLCDEIEVYLNKVKQLQAKINEDNKQLEMWAKFNPNPLLYKTFKPPEKVVQPIRQRIAQNTLEREDTQQKLDVARQTLVAVLDTFNSVQTSDE